RLRPGRQSPSALPGADGVAVGGETAGEPVAGGTVDRQGGGVCATQGQETSWENSGFVAEPVAPKRFLCSPRGSAHAPHISACPKKLTEELKTSRDSAQSILGIDFVTWEGFYRSDPQVLIPGEPD